jgi:hypothetical protein
MTQERSGPTRSGVSGSDQLGETTAQVKDTAAQLKDEAKERVGAVAAQAQEQVKSRLTTQKDSAAESLSGVAQALRQTGQQLRSQDQLGGATSFLDEAAAQVERFSGYLQGNDLNRFVYDVESFARRQPALFLGGAFLVGLMGARFLKSTRPNQYDANTYGGNYGNTYGNTYGTGAGYRGQSYGGDSLSGLSGYNSGTGTDFSSSTSTGYGGSTSGIYDAPGRTTERQSGTDETRSRSYGERLED